MSTSPVIDLNSEANEACVQAVPGAVFLRLRRLDAGAVVRRMFVEMTPRQARAFARELQSCIRRAERELRP